eukprot:4999666-Pyramimonas_sp.AAC.2
MCSITAFQRFAKSCIRLFASARFTGALPPLPACCACPQQHRTIGPDQFGSSAVGNVLVSG